MDGEALLTKVAEYFGQVEDHMKKSLEKTLQKLKILEPFEDQLVSSQFDSLVVHIVSFIPDYLPHGDCMSWRLMGAHAVRAASTWNGGGNCYLEQAKISP